MKCVLYSHEMHPIHVLEVDMSLINYMSDVGYFRLALLKSFEDSRYDMDSVVGVKYITIAIDCLRHSRVDRKDWIMYLPYVEDSLFVSEMFSQVPSRNPHDVSQKDIFLRAISNVRMLS